MTNLEFIAVALLISNAFFTGMAFEEIRRNVDDFRTAGIACLTTALFLAFGTVIFVSGYVLGFFWWSADKIDSYLNFKFYWKYLRGGYYSLPDHELIQLDRRCFAREIRPKQSLKYRHFIFCANLVFERNRYARKKWEVKDNFINEVK